MAVPPKSSTSTTDFQAFVSETYATARKAIEQPFDFIKEKFPAFENEVKHNATFYWEKLPSSTQRHVQLLWTKDAGSFAGLKSPYEKNLLEETGDWMLYPYSADLPQKFRTYQKNPIAIGMASTLFALFSLKCIFRPIKTAASVGRKIAGLPRLTYLFAQFSTIGLACRSMGRVTNKDLMDSFDGKQPPIK